MKSICLVLMASVGFLAAGVFGGTAVQAQTEAPTAASTPRKTGQKPNTPSPEMRKNMAKAHRQLADCLDSDRPIDECRQEMMAQCQQMGKEGCPMMGPGMGKGKGHGYGRMWGPPKGQPTGTP